MVWLIMGSCLRKERSGGQLACSDAVGVSGYVAGGDHDDRAGVRKGKDNGRIPAAKRIFNFTDYPVGRRSVYRAVDAQRVDTACRRSPLRRRRDFTSAPVIRKLSLRKTVAVRECFIFLFHYRTAQR